MPMPHGDIFNMQKYKKNCNILNSIVISFEVKVPCPHSLSRDGGGKADWGAIFDESSPTYMIKLCP